MKPINVLNLNKRNFSITDIQPDVLASQLTLIDLSIFKSITRDELLRNSTGVAAKQQCPNIQAMKQRFNQLTFWVVGQILNQNSPRQRAECLSYFIKTAKRLYQLNNLHSSNAVVSALFSSSIYRLDKTWHQLSKKYPKEKMQFEKLQELFADTNNYEALRKHLLDCELPCIPYLGLYSRDIIYIKEVHQEHEIQRTKSTSKILDSIARFQSSNYDSLVPMPDVQCLLMSSRYLEELQKFIEDANYQRSLEIEPPEHEMNFCSTNATSYLDNCSIERNRKWLRNPSKPNSDNFPVDQNSCEISHGSRTGNRSAHHPRRTNMLSGLTSIVHSAVVSTSNRFSGSLSPYKGNKYQGSTITSNAKYLIDDSLICSSSSDYEHVCTDTEDETNNNSMNNDYYDMCLKEDHNQNHMDSTTLAQSYSFRYKL